MEQSESQSRCVCLQSRLGGGTDLLQGQVLFAVKPHVAVLSTEKLDGYCSACFGVAPPSGLKRCTQCRSVWYCDSVSDTSVCTSPVPYPLCRPARLGIGLSTNMNVHLFSVGLKQHPLTTFRYLATPYDAWVASCGRNRGKD